MIYAVISDVHANLEALHAVLDSIKGDNVDRILFLGDIVGYGPDPGKCIESIRDVTDAIIAGNHDYGLAGKCTTCNFNRAARDAIDWTDQVLCDEKKNFLKNLPLTIELDQDNILLVHGSPLEPEQWHYIRYEYDGTDNLPAFDEKICLVGHTHVPFIMEFTPDGIVRTFDDYREIRQECRYIINAGSVGQPRDSIPDAAYVLLGENRAEIKRVTYDIVLTQKKMRKAGLPSSLINRLSTGR